jgi:Zn-dependent protease
MKGTYSLFNIFRNFDLMEFMLRVPAVLVALSFHEWGHAFAAYKLGDPTARNMGRLTINPIKHLDPVGLICMILFRFGWAKPVPVNPRNFSNFRRDDILVSIAGVSINLLLSFVFVGVYHLVFNIIGVSNYALEMIVINFCWINLGLMVFNLIPVPPLDGYHVFKDLTIRVIPPSFFMNVERYGNMILAMVLISGALNGILGYLPDRIIGGFEAFWMFVFGMA